MKEVFIGVDDVYATGSGGVITDVKDIDTLLAGRLAIFDDDNNLITAATTSANLLNSTRFYLAVGETDHNGNVYTRRSRLIDRNAFSRLKTTPVTGVARVDTVGGAGAALNLPSTLVAGTSAIIKIRRDNFMDADTPLQGRQRNIAPGSSAIHVDVVLVAGETDVTLVPKLVTAINTHPNNVRADTGGVWITAASTGASPNLGITLTVAQPGQEFHCATDGILIDSVVTQTTATTYPQGTAVQVAEMEARANIHNGDTNRYRQSQFWYKKGSQVVAGATYTTYTWSWKTERANAVGVDNVALPKVSYFVPSGAAALIAVIDGILAVVHSTLTDTNVGQAHTNIGTNP